MFVSLAFEPIVLISAAHLLRDETQLAARAPPRSRPPRGSIFAVVGQTHLLLRDVEFFEVENHLLLQAVRIRLDGKFGQVVENAGPDVLRARLFEGHHLVRGTPRSRPRGAAGRRSGSPSWMRNASSPATASRASSHQGGLLLVGDRIVLGGHHVGHAQHGLHQRGVPRSLLRTQPCRRAPPPRSDRHRRRTPRG